MMGFINHVRASHLSSSLMSHDSSSDSFSRSLCMNVVYLCVSIREYYVRCQQRLALIESVLLRLPAESEVAMNIYRITLILMTLNISRSLSFLFDSFSASSFCILRFCISSSHHLDSRLHIVFAWCFFITSWCLFKCVRLSFLLTLSVFGFLNPSIIYKRFLCVCIESECNVSERFDECVWVCVCILLLYVKKKRTRVVPGGLCLKE